MLKSSPLYNTSKESEELTQKSMDCTLFDRVLGQKYAITGKIIVSPPCQSLRVVQDKCQLSAIKCPDQRTPQGTAQKGIQKLPPKVCCQPEVTHVICRPIPSLDNSLPVQELINTNTPKMVVQKKVMLAMSECCF